MNNITTLVVHHVRDSYIDTLIKEVYNREYDIREEAELNGSVYKLYRGIDGKLSEGDEQDLQNFISGEAYHCDERIILNDLVRQIKIPSGNILIEGL